MNAKLEISGHAFEVTDRIREYAIKRIEKLNRHLNSLDEIRAELTKVETARNVKDRYVVELTVRGKNLLLRSEERAEDVRKALNEAVEKMDRRMAHYKGKHYHGRGNGQT
jgi:putative sigma-54 modulation protein